MKPAKRDAQVATTQADMYFLNPVKEVKVGTEDVFEVQFASAKIDAEIKFSSSVPEVIEVDEKTGAYRAVLAGESTIRAEFGEAFCEMEVRVYKPVQDITGIQHKISLKEGESKKIQYKLLPEDVDAKATFLSENEAIATISEDGVIAAKKAGKTKIVISVRDYSEAIELTVIKATVGKKDSEPDEKKETEPTPEASNKKDGDENGDNNKSNDTNEVENQETKIADTPDDNADSKAPENPESTDGAEGGVPENSNDGENQ